MSESKKIQTDSPSRQMPPGQQAHVPQTIYSLSEDETLEFGRTFARNLKGGELILLEGELGTGKTVFTRGVALGLGIPPEDVTSPSYTLVQEYPGGRLHVFHIDLYRLEDPDEAESLGLQEILAAGGLVLIEWGEKLPPYYRRDSIRIRFHDVGEGSRRIELLTSPTKAPSEKKGDA
jgi:tRNA threonylcarbamoyladenosine biosynthesis protein TsaE